MILIPFPFIITLAPDTNEWKYISFVLYLSINRFVYSLIDYSFNSFDQFVIGSNYFIFSMRKKQTYRSFPFNVCERKYFNTFFSIEWEKLERRRFNVCSRWFASKIFAYLFYLLSKSRRKVKTKNDNSTTNRNTPNTSHRKYAHKHIRAEWASGQEIEGKKGAKLLLSGF